MASIIAYDANGNIHMARSWSGKADTADAQRALIPSGLEILDVPDDHPVLRNVSGWQVKNAKLVPHGKPSTT